MGVPVCRLANLGVVIVFLYDLGGHPEWGADKRPLF